MNLTRLYAIGFGVVYTLVGILGFFVAPTLETHNLIIFPVNVLHNIVHLLAGLAGIAFFMSNRALQYARGMAIIFAVLTVAGLIVPNGFGLVPLGGADIALHAATAILAAVAGWLYVSRKENERVAY
ncbi:MAG: DUF4383 domain-containing protein [Actinomycetota bacterium]|nr:DUF4383 domain-containing protein [Actinomycetota bacterium]